MPYTTRTDAEYLAQWNNSSTHARNVYANYSADNGYPVDRNRKGPEVLTPIIKKCLDEELKVRATNPNNIDIPNKVVYDLNWDKVTGR